MLNGDKLKESIEQIKAAVYGSEVRDAMASALECLEDDYSKLEEIKDEMITARENIESTKADIADKVEQLQADRDKLESLQEEIEKIKGAM